MKQIKRCFLFWQMKSLEILIDGQSECLDCVRDPYIINRIIIAQINARNELRKVRASYNSLKGLSDRDGWRLAR